MHSRLTNYSVVQHWSLSIDRGRRVFKADGCEKNCSWWGPREKRGARKVWKCSAPWVASHSKSARILSYGSLEQSKWVIFVSCTFRAELWSAKLRVLVCFMLCFLEKEMCVAFTIDGCRLQVVAQSSSRTVCTTEDLTVPRMIVVFLFSML